MCQGRMIVVPCTCTAGSSGGGLLSFLAELAAGAVGLLLLGVVKVVRGVGVGLLVATVWATPRVIRACQRAWARWQHRRAVAAATARLAAVTPTVAEPARALPQHSQHDAGPLWSELHHKRPANVRRTPQPKGTDR